MAGAFATGNAGARTEAPTGLGEEDFFDELPLVLTVTRLPRPVAELPASVTVIDRETIAAADVLELPDLLRLVPGFQVGHFDGTRTSVTYHGVSDQFARRMQVLVDGRSVYTPATGGVEWHDLPLAIEDIERIEVTRGPNGAAYGANAFLGTINIITRHAGETHGATLSLRAGDGFYRRAFGRIGAAVGHLDYRISLMHSEDAGYRDLDPDGHGEREVNDDKRTDAASFRGDYRASVNDYVTFSMGYSRGPRETGESTDPGDPAHEKRMESNFQHVKWKHIASSDEEFNVQFYHNYHDVDDRFRTKPLSVILSDILDTTIEPWQVPLLTGKADQTLPRDTSIRAERVGVEFTHLFAPARALRAVWGMEARVDEVTGAEYFDTDETFQNRLGRIFADGEWRLTQDWIANVGAMAEQGDIGDPNVASRFALNHLLNAGHFIRFAFSTAYRTPAWFEEEADFTVRYDAGDPFVTLYTSAGGIEPEKIESYEIGFGGESVDKRLTYDVKIFNEQLSNLIVVPKDVSTDQYIFQNNGHAAIRGFELQLKIRPQRSFFVVAALSHAETTGRMADKVNPDEDKDLSTATPKDTVSLLLSHRSPSGLRASAALYHVSDMQFSAGDRTGGYTTADFTVGQELRRGGNEVGNIAFSVKDLLGNYYDFQEEVFRERRSYVTLTLNL